MTGPKHRFICMEEEKGPKSTIIYTLIDDDMERIGYRLRDAIEEVLEETTKKQEELQMKVQDQCLRLQQLLETV
jgi:hypothetical protein